MSSQKVHNNKQDQRPSPNKPEEHLTNINLMLMFGGFLHFKLLNPLLKDTSKKLQGKQQQREICEREHETWRPKTKKVLQSRPHRPHHELTSFPTLPRELGSKTNRTDSALRNFPTPAAGGGGESEVTTSTSRRPRKLTSQPF